MGVPFFTAYKALILRAKTKPGETVLVHGARYPLNVVVGFDEKDWKVMPWPIHISDLKVA